MRIKTITQLRAVEAKQASRAIDAMQKRATYHLELVGRIRGGETTGDRQLDFAYMLAGSSNIQEGLKYYNFELELMAHPGELLVLETTWEVDLVKRIHAVRPQFESMYGFTAHETAYVVGVISKEPRLGCSTKGALQLPIDRLLLLYERPSGSGLNFKEIEESVVSISDLGSKFWQWMPEKDNYLVGNGEVIEKLPNKLRWSYSSYLGDAANPLELIFSALGIEHFDADGQGVLGVPDPAAEVS